MMKKRGFTLIELLVVIAIIGILASIVLVSVNSAREKARNIKRVSDIQQYVLALEMYYDADNWAYPNPGVGWYCLGDYAGTVCWEGATNESDILKNALSKYVPALPVDETVICGYDGSPANCYYGYMYRCLTADCYGFDIRWFMEGDNQSCGAGRNVVGAVCTDCTYCRHP